MKLKMNLCYSVKHGKKIASLSRANMRKLKQDQSQNLRSKMNNELREAMKKNDFDSLTFSYYRMSSRDIC